MDRQHAGSQQGGAQGQRRDAHELLLRPGQRGELSAWNYYFCPVAGAQEEIAQFDKSAASSDFIFLDDKTLETGHQFMALSDQEERDYQRMFNEVMSG